MKASTFILVFLKEGIFPKSNGLQLFPNGDHIHPHMFALSVGSGHHHVT